MVTASVIFHHLSFCIFPLFVLFFFCEFSENFISHSLSLSLFLFNIEKIDFDGKSPLTPSITPLHEMSCINFFDVYIESLLMLHGKKITKRNQKFHIRNLTIFIHLFYDYQKIMRLKSLRQSLKVVECFFMISLCVFCLSRRIKIHFPHSRPSEYAAKCFFFIIRCHLTDFFLCDP